MVIAVKYTYLLQLCPKSYHIHNRLPVYIPHMYIYPNLTAWYAKWLLIVFTGRTYRRIRAQYEIAYDFGK